MLQPLLVLTNMPDAALAHALAQQLVERRLAACATILPPAQSVYQWQGVVEQAHEITLLIKTVQARYAELEAAIKEMHPYEVPEIVALPIVAGLPAYLDWIANETKKDMNA